VNKEVLRPSLQMCHPVAASNNRASHIAALRSNINLLLFFVYALLFHTHAILVIRASAVSLSACTRFDFSTTRSINIPPAAMAEAAARAIQAARSVSPTRRVAVTPQKTIKSSRAVSPRKSTCMIQVSGFISFLYTWRSQDYNTRGQWAMRIILLHYF
jgi:hypothetical protein